MINITLTDMTVMVAFWLSFSRWITVIFQLPMFEHNSIPFIVKVLIAIFVTYAFFPLTKDQMLLDINYIGENSFWVLTIFNTVIGLIIGFFVRSFMNIFLSTGSLITQQIGLNAVSYFDPQSGGQTGPFERLIEWTVLMMILSSGALLPMFKGVVSSFSTVHVYNLGKMGASVDFYMMIFKSIFVSSIMLASPMIFINLFITCVMGIISRAVPQLNVIMVSFAVNIGLGLLVFVIGSDEFFQTAFKIYTEKLGEWFLFLS